jgi:hypothetical protein
MLLHPGIDVIAGLDLELVDVRRVPRPPGPLAIQKAHSRSVLV